MEFYDGDERHEGAVDEPRDYVAHQCEVNQSAFGVLKGTACPNRRFGCDFVAEVGPGETEPRSRRFFGYSA